MKRLAGLSAAVALAGCAAHASESGATPIAPIAASSDTQTEGKKDRVLLELLSASGFEGVIGYSSAPGSYNLFEVGKSGVRGLASEGAAWPWASMTKQVLAVMVLQEAEDGKLALDEPLSRYLPSSGNAPVSPTIQQLLQHRSGLRNPDDSPVHKDEWPSFYTSGATGPAWCSAERGAPLAEGWRYNNCDYIVLGAVLEKVTGNSLAALFEQRIAKPAGLERTSFATPRAAAALPGSEAIYGLVLSRFGAAGGLIGTVTDMLRFDRALLEGKLLGADAREVLWTGDPALGYMALGQWVFDAPIKGCAAPVHIVERRGAIGKYQVRNIILPESSMAIALVTDLSEKDYDFGEVWTGEGPMHDVLTVLACQDREPVS
ncbi:serine hydrolase domain-containing protein [Qipengyuania sp.]|uniref:serine hydrolase domain-containing protein n=1 Tax=Qipengyuania sp. TaxID=2004515 RepID=UPI0035C7D8F5